MIKYKFFETSGNFELWQSKKKRKISQISPVPNTVRSNFNEESKVDMSMEMGIFVVYFEE